MKSLFAIIGALVVSMTMILGILMYSAIAWGFVATKLWEWFMIPLFPTMPHLKLVTAIGLLLVVGCFIHTAKAKTDDTDKEKMWGEFGAAVLAPWITLLFAWVVTLFY